MSKLFYILTIFAVVLSTYTFADDEKTCPDGSAPDADGNCPPVEQLI